MAEKTVSIDMVELVERVRREHASRKLFYSLTFLSGSLRGSQRKIEARQSYAIGRQETCSIRLDDTSVSRVHAIVGVDADNRLTITDGGSLNGTFVNADRVERGGERVVQPGDKIRLGDSVVLRVDLRDELDDQLFQSMYEAAVKDAMTGVYNKRYLQENLTREFALSQRHGLALSVIMFDVDHFKKVNDTFGHQAGDGVLVHIAKVVGDALRTEDLLCRYGGEEFVVVTKNQTLPSAALAADRLRTRIERSEFLYGGEKIPVTISLGVTSTSVKRYESPDEMIRDADMMLYEAKRGGRNRSHLFMGTPDKNKSAA